MGNHSWKVAFIVFITAALVLSGCSFSINLGNTTPTTQPPAVVVASPVASPSGGEGRPTESATTSSSTSSKYTLSTTQYINPEGAFALYPPEGWDNQAKDSKEKVEYISPDGSVLITTMFTNTGYKLDTKTFENYIGGNQINLYAIYTNYAELSREMHLDQGYGMVYVTFDYNNVPQEAERLYQQEGNVIFETEFWTDKDKWDGNVDFFNKYLAGVKYDDSKVSNYEPYMFVQKYVGGDNLFSFDYLTPWMYQVNKTNDKNLSDESFISPDGYGFIEVLYYNDNKTYYSQGNAGQWALSELESYYAKGSGDLKIDKDQINSNGFEQLNWHTLQDKYVGITVFLAKDTEIMQLTVGWQKDYADTYQSSLEYTISTFTSPPAQ